METPFSNDFVQLCHSYAGPHEEAKLPQGPNGTARITAGPVPSMGGKMSGIGKQNMLDTINDQPNYKICKQVPSLITKSKLSKASKNLRKIGVALRYFAPRHPPEKVGKKSWPPWWPEETGTSCDEVPRNSMAEPLTEVAKMAIPALQYMDHLERARTCRKCRK